MFTEETSDPCSLEFEWHAELTAHAEKPLTITVFGKEVSGTTDLLKVLFSLSGRCVEGNLTFDTPEKKTKPVDPDLGLKRPEDIPKGPWDKFIELIPNIYDKFKATPAITANKKSESCVEISFSAELSSDGEFDVTVPLKLPGGGGEGEKKKEKEENIKIHLTFPKEYPPVKGVWTICCCDLDDGKCSWSARKDKYEFKGAEFADRKLLWTLDADLGGCGQVKLVKNIKPKRFL